MQSYTILLCKHHKAIKFASVSHILWLILPFSFLGSCNVLVFNINYKFLDNSFVLLASYRHKCDES